MRSIDAIETVVGNYRRVGLARGIGALDLRVVGKILVSWVATLPIGAALFALVELSGIRDRWAAARDAPERVR